MNNINIFIIPGLGMNSSEISCGADAYVLQNFGFGVNAVISEKYDLYDLAEYHLKFIKNNVNYNKEVMIIGMSMGGMVTSILASRLRNFLPIKTKFRFLVTSANLENNPAIPDSLFQEWLGAKKGCYGDFEKILKPFFSLDFYDNNISKCKSYFQYRADGLNLQSSKEMFKQIQAIKNFRGIEFYSSINEAEATFVHGCEDNILSAPHHKDLIKICPDSKHIEVINLGHMINMEAPQFFLKEIHYE